MSSQFRMPRVAPAHLRAKGAGGAWPSGADKVLVFRSPRGSVLEIINRKPKAPPDDPHALARWLVEERGFRL